MAKDTYAYMVSVELEVEDSREVSERLTGLIADYIKAFASGDVHVEKLGKLTVVDGKLDVVADKVVN